MIPGPSSFMGAIRVEMVLLGADDRSLKMLGPSACAPSDRSDVAAITYIP